VSPTRPQRWEVPSGGPGESLTVRKPEPEHLPATIRNLGITPAQTVLVGDSRIDAECARRADVDFVLVDWGVPEPGCTRIDSFLDLVQHVADPHLTQPATTN
jgi:phosphoglycolate phosphatase